MRKTAALVLILFACLLPASLYAAKSEDKTPPLTAVFGAAIGMEDAPVSLEVTAAVMDHISRTGQLEPITYTRDLPNIARAVLEKRLPKEAVDDPWDPKNAARIAKVLKTEYALCLKGGTGSNAVSVELVLVRVSDGKEWKATAQSEMAVGPRQGIARSNAVSTAASSAVSQVLLEAFEDSTPFLPSKPRETEKPVITPAEEEKPQASTSEKAEPAKERAAEPKEPEPTEPGRDVSAEYKAAMKQAEVYLAKQDMRNAALELRNAINLDPLSDSARVRLAGVYADMGMTNEAIDECKRALQFHGGNVEVINMLVKLYLSDGRFAEAADYCRELVKADPKNVEAHIALGDISWNQGKVDDSAAAYEAALKVDSGNAVAHGRLQKLFSARKMHAQSLKHMLAVKVPSAEAEPDAPKRYLALAGVIQDEFAAVLNKMSSARQDFDQGRMSREDYYKECKDTANRIDALASYLSTQTAPTGFREANPHGVLATSLLSQATGYMVTYLETEKQHYRDQAALLEGEAKTEMSLFAKALSKNG